MPQPHLNLVVVRSREPERLMSFYQLLGITFQLEQHGTGPVHWAADLDKQVMEIYPSKSMEDVDSTTRLGFRVRSMTEVMNSLRSGGVEIIQEAKQSTWGLRAIVRDPDGRYVELAENRESDHGTDQRLANWIVQAINNIYTRPFMYVGTSRESHALDCVLHMMHATWAEAACQQSQYTEAQVQISAEEGWNAIQWGDWYRNQHPDALDDNVLEYTLSCWKRISSRLGILQEESQCQT
ncbi:MAG TPA: VOC family protein [Planctomicrobium sp.]|nr:VOC family protein [Planctomicrobium sp.]